MVRPIKFRAWHKYGGGMMVVDSLYFINDLVGVVDKSHETRVMGYSFADVEIMQYTGLKDKYRKEIYEGDIGWNNHSEYYGLVKFEAGKFIYEWDNICEDLSEAHDGIEIVGNVYENPELLKGAEPNDDQS